MTDRTELKGICQLCNREVIFWREGRYWRNLKCPSCKSTSRNRAFWYALNGAFPNWRQLAVHESSPGWDIVSQRLVSECEKYTASQFEKNVELGSIVSGTNLPCRTYFIEDLERQTFKEKSFDLVVMQDVFEHIFDPVAAIIEIKRTLRDNGALIMTVPVIQKFRPSRRRARLIDGIIDYMLPPEYHGNPVDSNGALVTIDWGYDIAEQLASASGMQFIMQTFESVSLGILDECNQVLIGYKSRLIEMI